jgi:hypothetical protein
MATLFGADRLAIPPSLRDGMSFQRMFQPLRGWLISGCPFGTKGEAEKVVMEEN